MLIDAHAHIGPEISDPAARKKIEAYPHATAEDYIQAMDEAGIDMGISVARLDMDNAYQAEIQRKYSKRIISCAFINPRDFDAEDKLKKCAEEWGLRGLKLNGFRHCYSCADHTLLDPLMKLCEKYHLPVIMHVAGDNCMTTPLQFEEMARSYPEITFIMSHGGNLWLAEDGTDVGARNKNVIVDSTSMEGFRVTHNAKVLPQGRFAMGSDWPLNNLKSIVYNIKRCVPDEASREWVLGRAMAQAFGIEWN